MESPEIDTDFKLNRTIQINPSENRNDGYIKYYDSSSVGSAQRVARILLRYYKYTYHKDNLKQFKLNSEEKKNLIDMLTRKNVKYSNQLNMEINNYQAAIIIFNRYNHMTPEETANFHYKDWNETIKCLPIDYPMPDYRKL